MQRRRLRSELRRAREAAGLKQADVAKAMDWSQSKLIRIESGQVSISTNDLRALLAHYNVKDGRRTTSLLELAKSSRGSSFYDQFSRGLKPGFREYLAYEGMASVIRQWEPIFIPGLAQTEEYARQVLSGAAGLDEDGVEEGWLIRQHRQEVHERETPPDVYLVLDEATIRREVGGPRTMALQLERLKNFAGEPQATVQVMPEAVGAHPGMLGPFVLLEFGEADLEDLVHLESVDDVTIKNDAELIGRYSDRFALLQEMALSPEDSLALLDKVIAELTAEGGEARRTDRTPAGV